MSMPMIEVDQDYIYANDTYHIDTHLYILVSVCIWTVLMSTIVFGSVGNILVLYIYSNRKDNKTCTLFIKVLAVVDLTICILIAPLELYQTTQGIYTEFLCKIYAFLSTHVLYSTFLITIIAFDRYFCICWPLYKIITIKRARVVVFLFGVVSSLLAIIPMCEYSTIEHHLQMHANESYIGEIYVNVELHKPLIDRTTVLENTTHVKCSPRFSYLLLTSFSYIHAYRRFHSAIFAVCTLLVLVLYGLIYRAVYQRRCQRTRKLSQYRRIVRSYIINDETNKRQIKLRRYNSSPTTLKLLCCYCCRNSDDIIHHFQRDRLPSHYEPSQLPTGNHHNNRHRHKEHPFADTNGMRNGLKSNTVVMEVNGARGKRYSTISTTSITYLTSGVWDDSSTVRSRINSITATSYCGEHSSSRPSTSTEDSFDHSHLSLSYRPTSPSISHATSTHLTIPTFSPSTPGRGTTTSTLENLQKCNINIMVTEFADITEADEANEDNTSTLRINTGTTIPRSITQSIAEQSALTTSSTILKTGNVALKRTSDESVFSSQSTANTLESRASQQQNRKVSFVNPRSKFPDDLTEQQNSTMTPSVSRQSLSVTNINSTQNPLNTTDSRKASISSRRPSTFDCETQRMLERQETQERLSNIRTTLTLFMVTATFIMMYLPSIVHTLFYIKPHLFREVLWLLFYVNSAANPLIYSFFNVNFRNDIKRIYECQRRQHMARHG